MPRNLFFIGMLFFTAFFFSGCNCMEAVANKPPHQPSDQPSFAAWKCGSISNMVLWGLPVFWWGRIGEILQVIGGLMAIADVIGAPRLKNFGQSIRQHNLLDQLRQQGGKIFWLFVYLIFFFTPTELFGWGKKGEEKNKRIEDSLKPRIGSAEETAGGWSVLITISLLIYGFVSGVIEVPTSYDILAWLEFLIVVFILFYIYLFGLMIAFYGLIIVFHILRMIFGTIIIVIFINPLAWVASHPQNSNVIKLLSLSLLAVGFILDFIAS